MQLCTGMHIKVKEYGRNYRSTLSRVRIFNKGHYSFLQISVKQSLAYIFECYTLLLSVNATSVNHFQSGVIWLIVLYFPDA